MRVQTISKKMIEYSNEIENMKSELKMKLEKYFREEYDHKISIEIDDRVRITFYNYCADSQEIHDIENKFSLLFESRTRKQNSVWKDIESTLVFKFKR